MKSRIILNRERTAKAQEISIPIHGKGGELGIKAVTGLVGLIETLKDCGTCQEVQSVFDAICGYNAYMTAQHYLCERCGEPAKIVHHKIWLTPKNIHEQSITLCWDNLEALCQDCHNKEHHAKNVRAKRYAFTADGELIPPIQKNIFHSR